MPPTGEGGAWCGRGGASARERGERGACVVPGGAAAAPGAFGAASTGGGGGLARVDTPATGGGGAARSGRSGAGDCGDDTGATADALILVSRRAAYDIDFLYSLYDMGFG